MSIFKKKKPSCAAVQTADRCSLSPAFDFDSFVPSYQRLAVYESLRDTIPIIDAAITKLVRLTGGFTVRCQSAKTEALLNDFLESVPVSGSSVGISSFLHIFFDQMLTYGTGIGEIILKNGKIAGLYNAPLKNIELKRGKDGFTCEVWAGTLDKHPVRYPELILLSVLNPEPGKLCGTSLLHGLPFVSSVLMKIYNAVGQNWDRVGNVRFAVTYKPTNDTLDRAYAKERAVQVAREWSETMQSGSKVKDFVTVGDVSIKVIGAESPIPDSEIPVRQMLEQIVAKTGLPPFLLGLSWSSTERMSSQQADVLTSELEAYRRLLTPVILKICKTFLTLCGITEKISIEWDKITLQDEVELSRAKLYNAEADKLINEGKEVSDEGIQEL